jgi:hypothetical protein
VIDDVLALIHDPEARGQIARLIECVLVFPSHLNMAQSDSRYFLLVGAPIQEYND